MPLLECEHPHSYHPLDIQGQKESYTQISSQHTCAVAS